MSARVLFWQESFRATGHCSAETAKLRLRTQLSVTSRFSAEERLLGRLDGGEFRVWKRTLLGASADVVQLEGRITQGPEGALAEGTFSFKAATKVQFIGFLALGMLIALSGALQRMSGVTASNDVILLGAGIAGLTALWLAGAYSMRDRQIDFIKSRISEILAPETA